MTYLSADQMAVWAESAFRDGIRKANSDRNARRLAAKRAARERCRQLKDEINAITYDLGARTPEEREADRKALSRITTLGRSFGGVYASNRGVVASVSL